MDALAESARAQTLRADEMREPLFKETPIYSPVPSNLL